jgi:hypothetical protein
MMNAAATSCFSGTFKRVRNASKEKAIPGAKYGHNTIVKAGGRVYELLAGVRTRSECLGFGIPARVMAEELKSNVFELRRTGGLSAKPFFSHVFPERGHVPESAAHAARLISHGVKRLLDARVDDPREAHGAGFKGGVKNQPFNPPGILLFTVLEPLTLNLILIPVQQIHLSMHVTAKVRIVLPVVTGFNNLTCAFTDQARADTAVSFVSSFNSLPKGHEDKFVIWIPRVRDIGVDTLLKIFDAWKWKGHLLRRSSGRREEQAKKKYKEQRLPFGMVQTFHRIDLRAQ